MKKFSNTSEYIKSFPPATQKQLQIVRKAIKSVVPKAEEDIKWGMPAFVQGKILVMFGGFKSHIGFYPTPSALTKFLPATKKYKQGKGSIQFPLTEPMPLALIKKMTKMRLAEEKKNWKQKN